MLGRARNICAQRTNKIDKNELRNIYQKCQNLQEEIKERYPEIDLPDSKFAVYHKDIEEKFRFIADRIEELDDLETSDIIDDLIFVFEFILPVSIFSAVRRLWKSAKKGLSWAQQDKLEWSD